MEEVKIEISRATNLLSNIVKIVTVISFLLFILTFYVYKYKTGIIYKRQVALCDVVLSQGLTDNAVKENFIQRMFTNAKSNCFDRATRTTGIWAKMSFLALDISILLPLVYFGGGKLVKESTEKYLKKQELTQSPQQTQ